MQLQEGGGNLPPGWHLPYERVVYGAKVTKTSDQTTETYTGLTARRFKDRYYEHTSNSNNESERDKTALAGHIWNLKRQGEDYTTSW